MKARECVRARMCVCLRGGEDLMGFPAQQNAPARLAPPTCSGVCAHPHTHSSYRSDRQPQGHSSDGWTHPGVFYCWPVLSSAIEEQTTIIRDTPEKREEDGVGWLVCVCVGGGQEEENDTMTKGQKWTCGNCTK